MTEVVWLILKKKKSLFYHGQEVFCKCQINDNLGKRNMESVLNVEIL